jgi:hypothetical protein
MFGKLKKGAKQDAARIDALSLEIRKADKASLTRQIEGELKLRVDAFQSAKSILGEVEFDATKTATDWHKAALQKRSPELKIDSYSADQISAAFDVIQLVAPNYTQEAKSVIDAVKSSRVTVDADDQVRNDMAAINAKYENAWRVK